jgi:hypothetical protein
MTPERSFMDTVSEAFKDPGETAQRGKWLARGAWLLAAGEILMSVKNHVADRLSSKERDRLVEIVRSSKGRPSNLSNRERAELQAMLIKVEPRELAKKVATSPLANRMGPGRRRK